MFYTYIIQSSKNKRWYTGCIVNLRKRFKEHNDNLASATKGRSPFIPLETEYPLACRGYECSVNRIANMGFILIYYEACLNKDDAYTRERYLKLGMGPVRNLNGFLLRISNGVGKRYLKNRLKRFLSLTG